MAVVHYPWSEKRVLVTGGAGFIGSHLVELLVDAGAATAVLDTFGTARDVHVVPGVTVWKKDVRNVAWEPFLADQRPDIIFHLAANAYVPPSVDNPTYDYQTNLDGTFRLLEVLRRTQWRGILIYASSAAVYGNALRLPIQEGDPTVPLSPYGVGKLAAERYVAVFSHLYGLRTASLRIFSTYGPRQRKQVVYDLIQRITQNPSELFLYGDGSQVRDFNYVDDTARAAMVVVERGRLQGETYNVGSGRDCSVRELIENLCHIMGMSPRLAYSGSVRPGDPERLFSDISRLSALGYQPHVPLEEGLRRTVAWYERSHVRAP